jgi:MFS family permease
MIAFRALQGFLGGSMIPTAFTTAFVYFNGNQRIIAAATIGAISSLAPTLGPTIGGWITFNYSWHWLFFVNLVPGAFVAIIVPMLVKIDKPDFSLLKGASNIRSRRVNAGAGWVMTRSAQLRGFRPSDSSPSSGAVCPIRSR